MGKQMRITVKHFETQSVWVSEWSECPQDDKISRLYDMPENSTMIMKSEKNEYDCNPEIFIPAKIWNESVRIIEYR